MKMAGVVKELGYDVTIIGRRRRACCETDNVPFRTIRFRMIFNKGFLFYKSFNIRLFFYLLFHRFDILVANDLDTLLPNYLVSKLRRLPLVYDSHEYFTGVPELNGRPFVKWVWTSIEKFVFPDLKHVITVSDSIADLYHKQYGIMPVVIRNLSPSSQSVIPYRKDELNIMDGSLMLILQGGGINIDRGAEELLEAVRITEKVFLIIAGSGDVIPELRARVLNYGLSDRIKFFSSRPWNELMRLTKSADAGVCLEKDTSLNYRFCLPNKLFDYISAGIPVISGNLPEISKIISSCDCGIIIPEINRQEISRAIIKLRDNPDLLRNLKQNSVKASGFLNWENEKTKVALLYSRVLNLKAH